MPITFQKWITRADLKANPNTLYVFGDNHVRQGFGGQAKEMRGAKNSHGIATKWKPDSRLETSFFSDDYLPVLHRILRIIEDDLKVVERFLQAGGDVVIPRDGLGTGLSELPTRAPKVHKFIEEWVERMCLLYPGTHTR